tara:strand:+ start:22075 stop:22407 length:333 start_codon:yes stop_codon:yes gene_type:complete
MPSANCIAVSTPARILDLLYRQRIRKQNVLRRYQDVEIECLIDEIDCESVHGLLSLALDMLGVVDADEIRQDAIEDWYDLIETRYAHPAVSEAIINQFLESLASKRTSPT